MPPNERHVFSLGAGFLTHALRTPEAPALHINDTLFSYKELLRMTSVVAGHFPENSECVGVYCTDSVWSYAAMLAAVLTGRSYVPLNSKFPHQRLGRIAGISKVSVLISESEPPATLTPRAICIDKSASPKQINESIPADIAYILFTSGTTGEPKGVPVSTKNLEAFFDHFRKQYDFHSSDRFLQPYELSFDVSVFSMFAAWNAGACVIAVPHTGVKYINILKTLTSQRVTVSSLVPSVLTYVEKYLGDLALPDLRYSFFSGDRLFHRLAVKWQRVAPQAKLINCYGPTETTIVCTEYQWEESKSERESLHDVVPLGQPFEGTGFLLRNADGSMSPNGPAELCLSGLQVIDGYADGNNDRFFLRGSERYYRSGDVASLNENGNLLFHGRNDSQVKIDGYRVEIGEVENELRKISGQHIPVLSAQDEAGQHLVAFYEHDIDLEALRQELARILPAYMHPREFVRLDRLPVTANDKIDHQELLRRYHAGHVG